MKALIKITILAIMFGMNMNVSALTINIGGGDFTPDAGGTGSLGGSGADLFSDALILTFTNNGANTVRLTIDGGNLGGVGGDANKLTDVFFNIDPIANSITNFAHISGIVALTTEESPSSPGGSTAGDFDVHFSYSSSGQNGAFPHGSTSVYDLTGLGLTEDSFKDFLSSGSEPFVAAFTATKSGNTFGGNYGAGVSAVPIPAAVWLFGSALLGLLGFKRSGKNV